MCLYLALKCTGQNIIHMVDQTNPKPPERVMQDFNNEVADIYNRLSKELNIDIEKNIEDADKEMKEKGSHRISMSNYFFEKCLFEAKNLLNQQKYDQALSSLMNNFSYFVDVLHVRTKEDIKQNLHVQLCDYFNVLRDMIILYEEYANGAFKDWKSRLSHLDFFSAEELSVENNLSPQVQIYVNRALSCNNNGLFRIYNYVTGTAKLSPDDTILFYPQIGISEDIVCWLDFLKTQTKFSMQHQDKIVATLFLKLDDLEPHFSSFVITLHKGDSIWLATDQLEFANPYNRKAQSARGRSSGKIARKKEEHYQNIGLPYEIAFDIAEQIKNTTTVARRDHYETINLKERWEREIEKSGYSGFDDAGKRYDLAIDMAGKVLAEYGIEFNSHQLFDKGSVFITLNGILFKKDGRKVAYFKPEDDGVLTIYKSPEIFFRQLKELDVEEKYYYTLLVMSLLENIMNFPPKSNVMLAEQFVSQKLLAGETFTPQDGKFDGAGDDVKAYTEFLLESIQRKETALAKKDYSMVKANTDYQSNWLATPEQLDNLTKWCVLDSERQDIQMQLNAKSIDKAKDEKKLSDMLQAAKDRIFTIGFMAEKVSMSLYKPSGSFSEDNEGIVSISFSEVIKRDKIKSQDYRTEFRMFSVGKSIPYKEPCHFCGRHSSLRQAYFSIRHVDQLVFLLGLKSRFDLPCYYQNYCAHEFIPHHGNEILNNTHPYSRLEDPCSEKNSNGINIGLYACNICCRTHKAGIRGELNINIKGEETPKGNEFHAGIRI